MLRFNPERVIFYLLAIATIGFGASAICGYVKNSLETSDHVPESRFMPITRIAVIGTQPEFIGDEDARYTLIEYGDYECPPCRRAFPSLKIELQKYRGVLKFEFRNLPLTAIHPYSEPAAEAAEIARLHHKFWHVHDALYEVPDLDLHSIASVMSDVGLGNDVQYNKDLITAKDRIAGDIRSASTANIHSTPTFLLCTPDNKVIRLYGISELKDLIRN
jgi:protein-disulfide isomerase